MFDSEVLFSGYYGQKNTGDDAFVEVSNWGARKYWGIEQICYLAKKENLPSIKDSVKGFPLPIPKTYGFQQKLLLKKTKMLVSAGGSTFHNITPGSIKEETIKAKLKNKLLKIGAIGVSLGPFVNIEHEKKIIEYLKRMDFLSLRDIRSYEFAKTLNLPFQPINSFDLAALLPEIYKEKYSNIYKENKKKTIGVSISNYESYIKGGDLKNEKRRNDFIEKLIRIINYSGDYLFKFFIFNGNERNGDKSLTTTLISKLSLQNNFKIIPYNPSTEKTWQEIKACDLLISTRLHASIFACFADVPFFLIEYHKKCFDFLVDVGQTEKYRLFDADVNVEYASENILNVLENSNFIPPSNKNIMLDKSRLNFTQTLI